MRAELAGINHCAVPFLSRAATYNCAGTILYIYAVMNQYFSNSSLRSTAHIAKHMITVSDSICASKTPISVV